MKIEDLKQAITIGKERCCIAHDMHDNSDLNSEQSHRSAMEIDFYEVCVCALQAELDRQENKAIDMLSEKIYQPVWCADNKQWDIVMGCDGDGLDFAVLGYLTINQVKEMTFFKHKPREATDEN